MSAPHLLELLEATVRVPLQPRKIFSVLGELPAPGYGTMVAHLLFWVGLGCLLNVVSVFIRLPETAAGMGLIPVALGIAVALMSSIPISFFAAATLHVFALLSGGRGSYGRSYQIVSLLSCLFPLSAILFWLPSWTWTAPTLYGTYLAVRAVSSIHDAPSSLAWIMLGTLGLLLTAAQLVARSKISSVQQQLQAAMSLYPTLEALSPLDSSALWRPEADKDGMQLEDMSSELRKLSSSLEMIQQPGNQNSGLPAGVVPGNLPSAQELDQLQEMGLRMLEKTNLRLANDPKALKNLPPAQAAQIREMVKMANQLGAQLKKSQGGKVAGPRETQQLLQQMMQMMGTLQNPEQTLPSVEGKKALIPKTGAVERSGNPYEPR